MIEIKNLRLEEGAEWTRLVVDVTAGRGVSLPETTMWFALPNENAEMFNVEAYDPFVLVSYYMGMYFGQDVKICGKMSKLLYKNLTSYASQILDDFSAYTTKVELLVDGFAAVTQVERPFIGASCSCGIDSLCTIYDHYKNEDDLDYRINALFLFNCGTHGDYGTNRTNQLWLDRFQLNKQAALALNLPVYHMDSNLHAFTHMMYPGNDAPIGYLSIYSCVLCLQKYICKYYISSDFSYKQTLELNAGARDGDLSKYAGPMFVPLIRTEAIELIIDLPQYVRSERLERIADWDIAQKHLNICLRPLADGKNCTINCIKCRAAVLTLESLGKTELFTDVFDIDLFRREIDSVKVNTIARYRNEPLCSRDAVDYVKAHGMKMPPFMVAAALHSPKKIKWLVKKSRRHRT